MSQRANALPKVMVGIVTRDRASILARSIESVRAQDYPNLAIWILNDGSSDDTAALAVQFPEAKWTDEATSGGYVAARNRFMTESDAQFFVSLDDDAWFTRGDEVGRAIALLQAHPEVAVAGFDILSPDRPDRREPGPAKDAAVFIGCGHVLRLAAVHQVGVCVSAPGHYGGEEKDLALRLMDAGYRVVILPGVHVWHDKSDLARDVPAQHRSGVCNDFAMTLRRTPMILLPIALVTKFIRHFQFARMNGLQVPFRQGLRLFAESLGPIWKRGSQ